MKPVCLFFFANDIELVGQNLRSLAKEARAIEAAMEQASELCEFHIQKNTTAGDIRRTLAKYRHRIALVHYAGHAESLQLMLETDDGGKEGFRNETLAEFLRNQDNIELVFLNGCSTGDQVDALLEVGVPYVISTKKAVEDTEATLLSTAFYEGLSVGSTINESWLDAIAANKQKHYHAKSKSSDSKDPQDDQTRGGVFEHKVGEASTTSGFDWSLQSRPGIDPVPKWNLPEASNNPLLGLPALSADLGFPEEPFQHLRRFTRDEARVFFGRGPEVLSLYSDITSKHGPAVTLYYGQSGVGKSSLLDAGLLPRLEKDYQVVYVRRSASGIVSDVRQTFEGVGNESREWLLQSWKAKEASGKPLILILDQLEEAWTHGTSQEGNAEIEQLSEWLAATFRKSTDKPLGKAILVFRKEWFPEIDSIMKSHKVARSGVFLKRLTAKSVARAVRLNDQARDHYDLVVAETLAERIAIELTADSESPLAPTLQILLANMWKVAKTESRSQPEFSTELYQKLKHQGIQLSDFLDSQMAKVAEMDLPASQSGLVHSVLRFHCSEHGTAAVRTSAAMQEHFGDNTENVNEVVRCCRQHFLLVDTSSDSESSEGVTRLAHDTLAPFVLKQFHDSNRQAQHAGRILALRSQVLDGEPIDLLTRRELKAVKAARSWMRGLSTTEKTLLKTSDAEIKKANLMKGGFAAAMAMVSLVAFFWVRGELNSSEVGRRMGIISNTDASGLVANAGTFQDRPSLSWKAIERLQEENQSADTETNIALLRAVLGSPDVSEIVAQFKLADPEDVLSFRKALKFASDDSMGPLQKLIGNQDGVSSTDWNNIIQMRAKLTWLALLMERSDLLESNWFRPQAQAEPRTLLIKALAEWFIDDDEYIKVIGPLLGEESPAGPPLDTDLQAVLCQAVFFVSDSQLDDDLRQKLGEALVPSYTHDRIAVRSSARAALTRLNLFDQVRNDCDKTSGEDWFSIRYQTDNDPANDSVRSGVLDFAKVPLNNNKEIWLATTETPWQLAKRNLSDGTLKAMQEEIREHDDNNPTQQLSNTMQSSDGAPARFIVWSEAIEMCNLMTTHFVDAASQNYSQTPNAKSPFIQWENSPESGFRLPLAYEWQAAAAADSADDFCFGNRFDFLQYFAWTQETADRNPHDVAKLLPNANGFFDMHGNLQEWCWPAIVTATHSDDGKLRIAGTAAMASCNEVVQVKTRDGSYFESRDESNLDHQGDDIRGTKRELYMGFRLAISKRPDINEN